MQASACPVPLRRASSHVARLAMAMCASLGSNLHFNGVALPYLASPPLLLLCEGDEAFAGCSSLAAVDIPASVTSIGKQAFHESCATRLFCDSLDDRVLAYIGGRALTPRIYAELQHRFGTEPGQVQLICARLGGSTPRMDELSSLLTRDRRALVVQHASRYSSLVVGAPPRSFDADCPTRLADAQPRDAFSLHYTAAVGSTAAGASAWGPLHSAPLATRPGISK